MRAHPNKNKKFDKIYLKIIERDIETFLNEKISTLKIEGFTAAIILKQLNTYKELVYMYMYDDRPFSVA